MKLYDDFPWRKHYDDELLNEYDKLKDKLKDKIILPIPYSRIGYKCSNNFFQYERLKTPSQNKKSCFEFWNENKKYIIANRPLGHGDLFSRITFINYAPSQFPPVIAGQIYKYFNATNVLDPFAGWGDRCLAAMALDINYTGIDSNKNLKPLYNKMINFFPSQSKIKMIFKKCQDVNIDNLEFDFIFTSPPYWDNKLKLLENYYGCEKDYVVFMNSCLIPFIKNCMNKYPKIWLCLNIPKIMYDDLKKEVGKCQKILKFKTGSNKTNSNEHSKYKCNNVYCF